MSKAAKKKTDPRGLKRICMDCGVRFFDMNNRPIVCPSCKAEFTGEVKLKTRRGRAAAAVEEAESQASKKTAKEEEASDEEEEETGDAQIVSLDDLESSEKSADEEEETPKADLDLDEDDDDLDDLAVDDDLGDLKDLEPDAEIEEEDGAKDKKAKD